MVEILLSRSFWTASTILAFEPRTVVGEHSLDGLVLPLTGSIPPHSSMGSFL